METKTKLTTKLLITGISVFLLLLLVSGLSGLYTLKNSYKQTSYYIEAVNLARESQIYFQNQFHLWTIMVLQGEDFPEYKKNYHSFTVFADKVQDALFNLKLLCSDFQSIPGDIDTFRSRHKEITLEYLILTEKLVDSNFKNKREVLSISKGKNDSALSQMDELVIKIENAAGDKIKYINNRYFTLVLFSLILISLSVILMGAYLAKRILMIHKELEKRIQERTSELTKANSDLKTEILERIKAEELLNEANIQISLSEKKYRLLVENSNDIIFSLSEDWNFITVNKAIRTHLKISQEKVKSLNFLSLLNMGSNGRTSSNLLIKEKLENFLREMKPVNFIAQFTSSFASEPREMNVKMEFIEIEGRNEIHGIISPLIEDTLSKYFISEKQKFEIENYLTLVDDVTYNMIKHLKKYMEPQEIQLLRLGLREMILNAIEHGNLGITYEEKSEALINDTYRKLIEDRRNDPVIANKKVVIEYQIDPDKAVFKIADQGNGFDHKSALNKEVSLENANDSQHGRGILMSKDIFNEIKYNDTGNQVLLIKKF
ncbi:MAG: ATP-binding protein [Spirochaetota bacterium]